MAEITVEARRAEAGEAPVASGPIQQAFMALHIGFVVAPMLAGLDKFFNLLTFWPQYLWSVVPDLLGVSAQTFMYGVGVVELGAAVLSIFRPRLGGYVVGAWLVGIIVNLLLLGEYFDIALRDLGLAIGAFALARLAAALGKP